MNPTLRRKMAQEEKAVLLRLYPPICHHGCKGDEPNRSDGAFFCKKCNGWRL